VHLIWIGDVMKYGRAGAVRYPTTWYCKQILPKPCPVPQVFRHVLWAQMF
jgi:hypothetical protein